MLDNCCCYGFTNGCWNGIFNSCLNHARTESVRDGQNVPKVKIVREYDEGIRPSEIHDFRIVSFRITDLRPVHTLDVMLGKILHPCGREIHVDEYLHLDESGTSNSSERQAA